MSSKGWVPWDGDLGQLVRELAQCLSPKRPVSHNVIEGTCGSPAVDFFIGDMVRVRNREDPS